MKSRKSRQVAKVKPLSLQSAQIRREKFAIQAAFEWRARQNASRPAALFLTGDGLLAPESSQAANAAGGGVE
jgi:hypothetical protein